MDMIGNLSPRGQVLSQEKLAERRQSKGECTTCGAKCYKKKLLKLEPITKPGQVLNGRCLRCHPLDNRSTAEGARKSTMPQSTISKSLIVPRNEAAGENRTFSQKLSNSSGDLLETGLPMSTPVGSNSVATLQTDFRFSLEINPRENETDETIPYQENEKEDDDEVKMVDDILRTADRSREENYNSTKTSFKGKNSTSFPPSSSSILDDARLLIDEARKLDSAANPSWEMLQQSAEKYNEAAFNLKNYARRIPKRQDISGSDSSDMTAGSRELLLTKINEYENTANILRTRAETQRREQQQKEELIATAKTLFDDAEVHAERGETIEALDKYKKADKCYAAISESLPERMVIKTRLDELKLKILEPRSQKPSPSRRSSNANLPDEYTQEEIEVLLWSSRIASGVFQPWIDEEVRAYNFSPDKPWEDPDCVLKPLKLSKEQEVRFCKWARPSEIIAMRDKIAERDKTPRQLRNITMIKTITPYIIKQSCVSDCSFIAGLCVAAEFERRFNRRLVTSLIHPQSPDTGMPIYNEKGVYIIKLWFNGVERRVLVDDFLPVDENGELLCSHTENNDGCLELWVPILEKAYMKLCGGYDFPGSNSGVDLFCLTGWIPERIYFPEDPGDVKDFESTPDRVWERLLDAYKYGDYLTTVSTSRDLKEEEAKEMGLFTGHAYAVLRVYHSSNGTKLLQLKNPWASKGWTGRFSAQDKHSWSDPAFCDEVGYDVSSTATDDNGIFWMSWDDVLLNLPNVHVSWNPDPELFKCRTKVHGRWDANVGSGSENPQYTITVQRGATLWVLLSRHVTKQEQEGGAVSDFLTLHIHRIKDENQHVYYPYSNRILEGIHTNNQHVLARYDAESSENQVLSIVLSHDMKSNDVGYTLSFYCTDEFKLGRPKLDLTLRRTIDGSWKFWSMNTRSLMIGNAGGPLNKGSFGSNPQWSVRVPAGGSKIQVDCTVAKDLAVNVILARHGNGLSLGEYPEQRSRRIHRLYEDPIIDTGKYRPGYVVAEPVVVPAGLYTLVVSTNEVGKVGQFSLRLFTSKEIELDELA